MSIDLTITAKQDGTEPEDGMCLGELEGALDTLRSLGATDDTPLFVIPNRAHRIRTINAAVPGAPAGQPGPADSTGPHSRACGWRQHPHGSDCHPNCPTCHGVALNASTSAAGDAGQ